MDIPVLCLDTCIVLDILRDPTRKDVRVHEHEASLALLSAARSGTALEILVAEQVSREFLDNVEQVQQDARQSIGALIKDISKLNTLVALYGTLCPIDLGHWNGHDKRSRKTADRWFQISTTVRESSDTVSNAFLRLNQARSPARKGKQSMKDCVILETYAGTHEVSAGQGTNRDRRIRFLQHQGLRRRRQDDDQGRHQG